MGAQKNIQILGHSHTTIAWQIYVKFWTENTSSLTGPIHEGRGGGAEGLSVDI